MKKIYRLLVPKHIREKVKEIQEFQDYQKLRKHEGHTYHAFDKTQSIFVHIPKAGGISIIKSLYGERAGGFGHPTYVRFLKLFGKKHFNTYYKFTFVRNPWDRLHSAYSFLKKGGMNALDRKFSEEVMAQCPTFEYFVMEWLTPERVNNWVHFIPQYKYVTNEQQEVIVDFVGRFENFEADFKQISDKIGVASQLIHLNKSKEKIEQNYRTAYTSQMKDKVGLLYGKDIEIFKYTF